MVLVIVDVENLDRLPYPIETARCYSHLSQAALTELAEAWTKDRLGSAASDEEDRKASTLDTEVREHMPASTT